MSFRLVVFSSPSTALESDKLNVDQVVCMKAWMKKDIAPGRHYVQRSFVDAEAHDMTFKHAMHWKAELVLVPHREVDP